MKTEPVLLLFAAVAFGSIANAETVTLNSPLKAPSVVEFIAASGREVQAGEALLVLDTGSLLDKLHECETRRQAAEADLKADQEKIAPLETANANAIATASYDAIQAERAFNRYKEGEGPASELKLKLELVEAQSVLDRQQERYNARDKLLADGYIQKQEYEKEATTLTKAQYALEAAKLKLDCFVKYERDQMSDQLARALDGKKQALASAQAQAAKSLETAKAAVDASQKKLQTITAESDRIKGLLKGTVLYAPAAGQFVVGDPAHPENKIELGATLRSGQVIGVLKKP